jgi:phage terminase small subunit
MGRRGPGPKPAALRLLEGRSPGRDSGGRLVPTPPRPVFTPPAMPPGLPTVVRREWRRVVKELVDADLPTPAPAVLAGHCRALARQREVAAALEDVEIGSTTWRRLITTEGELAKRIAAFCAEFLTPAAAPAVPAVVVDGYGGGGQGGGRYNPFAPPETWPPDVRAALGMQPHDD